MAKKLNVKKDGLAQVSRPKLAVVKMSKTKKTEDESVGDSNKQEIVEKLQKMFRGLGHDVDVI